MLKTLIVQIKNYNKLFWTKLSKVSKDTYYLILTCVVVLVMFSSTFLTIGFVLGNLFARVSYLEGRGTGGGPLAGNQPTNPSPTQPTAPTDLSKPTKNDHIRGSTNAQLALIEYSDFDCPFCSKFHETILQALKSYDGKLMFVYRHFPLVQLHPEAFKKAAASECVFEQGGNDKFWNFADKIFGDDTEKVADLPKIVGDLGLDTTKFNDCLAADKYSQKVKDQIADGEKAGVQGTPGNFLMNLKDGKITPLRGAVPYEVLKAEIDRMLK